MRDMVAANAYQQYKTQSISTMTNGELLIMLYDELVKRVKQAELAITARNTEKANDSLIRAQNIIRYLMDTLDEKYDVAKDLMRLYEFFNQRLIQANMSKDAAILQELQPMLMELRDTWKQAEKQSHQ